MKDDSLALEMFQFIKARKAYWLAPIIVILLLMGILIVFAETSASISPFIYAMF